MTIKDSINSLFENKDDENQETTCELCGENESEYDSNNYGSDQKDKVNIQLCADCFWEEYVLENGDVIH